MQKMFIMKICCVPPPPPPPPAHQKDQVPAPGPFAMKITDQPHRKEPDVNLLSAGNFFKVPTPYKGQKF